MAGLPWVDLTSKGIGMDMEVPWFQRHQRPLPPTAPTRDFLHAPWEQVEPLVKERLAELWATQQGYYPGREMPEVTAVPFREWIKDVGGWTKPNVKKFGAPIDPRTWQPAALGYVKPYKPKFVGPPLKPKVEGWQLAPPSERELKMPRWLLRQMLVNERGGVMGQPEQVLFHEWSHVFQRPKAILRKDVAEGTATSFMRKSAIEAAKKSKLTQVKLLRASWDYERWAAKIDQERGNKWVMKDQFQPKAKDRAFSKPLYFKEKPAKFVHDHTKHAHSWDPKPPKPKTKDITFARRGGR